jgi:hypothetical protein
MKNSPALQALIRTEYPTLTFDQEEDLVNIVETVNPVGQHTPSYGYGLASSLTIPSLEPDYPEHGRNNPAYLLPQYAKKQPDPVFNKNDLSDSLLAYRALAGTDLKSRLIRVAQNLFVRYREYCRSLEFQAEMRPDIAIFEAASHNCEVNRNNLVMLAGEKAVDQLDQQLGIKAVARP